MKITVREMVTFSLLGVIMFISKMVMEFLPNIHMLAMLIVAYTVVYRGKALFPIYVFVFLTGALYGFGTWWVPYLYIWTILWGAVMLLPRNLPEKISIPVYMVVAMLHGLLYGTLYAPFQAIAFGLSFKGMLLWIAAGFPWDILHAVGNLCTGALIVPCIRILEKAKQM